MANAIQIVVNAQDNATRVFANIQSSIGMFEQSMNRAYSVAKNFAEAVKDDELKTQFAFFEASLENSKNLLLESIGVVNVLGDALQAAGQLAYIGVYKTLESTLWIMERIKGLNLWKALGEDGVPALKSVNEIIDRLNAGMFKTQEKMAFAWQAAADSIKPIEKNTKDLTDKTKILNDALQKQADFRKRILDLSLDADEAVRKGDARALAKIQRETKGAYLEGAAPAARGIMGGIGGGIAGLFGGMTGGTRANMSSTGASSAMPKDVTVNVFVDGEAVRSVARKELGMGMRASMAGNATTNGIRR